MKKITFVNDSEPYLSAENLNQLQENIEQATVKASSTEPTNENVWFKRGKNLLNKNDVVIGYYIPQASTSETLTASATALTSGWIPCKPNTQYVMSGHNKGRWQTKAQDGTITLLSEGANKITTNGTAKYMRVYFYGDYVGTIPNVQIEQGDTATPYEEYIEKEIYVKNDNGVFERFYKEPTTKNAITVYKNGMQSMTASGEIQFDTINTRLGTQLSLENNKIIIGDDIDKIKVSAQLWYYVKTGTRQWFSIRKNGATIIQTINVSANYTTAQLMPLIVPVFKGDVISLELVNFSDGEININNGASQFYAQTFLTIEEVK